MENYSATQYNEAYVAKTNSLMRKVYLWMSCALVITGATAWYVANSPVVLNLIFGNSLGFFLLFAGEFALVIALSAALHKLTSLSASLLFLLYSMLNGALLASIFFAYELGSIATTFFTTAGMFATMAVVGLFTKKDLSSYGRIFFMALIGLIISTVVNLFMQNSVFDMMIGAVGILIFAGLTAYDSQKIKALLDGQQEDETGLKLSVYGALSLYLDFINIFLYLLRFMGKRR